VINPPEPDKQAPHSDIQSTNRSGRGPQSAQSVPMSQMLNSAPGPPSSQSPSDRPVHVFVQMVCALVKPTIMARKMVRASRGTDPRRPAEPRRAEHDRAHIVSGRSKWEKASDRASEFSVPGTLDLPKQALTLCRRRSIGDAGQRRTKTDTPAVPIIISVQVPKAYRRNSDAQFESVDRDAGQTTVFSHDSLQSDSFLMSRTLS
jgi:hypothetical protein